MGRRWCPECRRMQTVVETFTDSYYDNGSEVGYTVTVLACDHETHSQGQVSTRPAPGAPWAPSAFPRVRDALNATTSLQVE